MSTPARKAAFAITAGALALLYLPLAALVFYSFVDPAGGFTLEWYARAFANEEALASARRSLGVGLATTGIATGLGTLGALALQRSRFPGRRALEAVVHIPLVMPELVLGLSLLVWFVFLRISLGVFSVVLAHVTFTLSYVLITVRARLEGFDRSLEEAALDLGASPFQVFRHVTLPLIRPGIVSGALIAFTLSFDDFLVTFFTAGPGSETLPLRIYGMIRHGVSPEIHALSTLLLAATLVPIALGGAFTRNRR
ncbi:MAG: ABC transporter permease [Oligoflexia bacterium]|nr:ABC transporter permease [Oligoflexia bacterium]